MYFLIVTFWPLYLTLGSSLRRLQMGDGLAGRKLPSVFSSLLVFRSGGRVVEDRPRHRLRTILQSGWSLRHVSGPHRLRCSRVARSTVSSPIFGRCPGSERCWPVFMVCVPDVYQNFTNGRHDSATVRDTMVGTDVDAAL